MGPIYLDYASTAPTDPDVLRAMEPYFTEKFGNASSPHAFGREANKAMEDARQTLTEFIGARPEEIVFTSGATESNNQAVLGVARGLREKGKHIIVSRVEHHSVMEVAEFLDQEGWDVTYLPVDRYGRVDPEQVRSAIKDETVLIAVMHASNEIGTVQPVAEIGRIAKEKKIPFLVDAVQTVGHLPVNVNELNCDLLSLSAHKFYGPKGVGALYIRTGTAVRSFILGGDQERGRRASTQNVAGIVGLGKAVAICREKMVTEAEEQSVLRDRLIRGILNTVEGAQLNGHPAPEGRLPNNAHFSFPGVDGEALLMSLDMEGMACSQGSACTSGALEPSHVLRAIALSDEAALSALRISIGRWTTAEHIEYCLEKIPEIIERLKQT